MKKYLFLLFSIICMIIIQIIAVGFICGLPGLVLLISTKSIIVSLIVTFMQILLLHLVPSYLKFWRKSIYLLRVINTYLFTWFLRYSQNGYPVATLYADVNGYKNADSFYQQKKKSIRKRMLKEISKDVLTNKIDYKVLSSDEVSIKHLMLECNHVMRVSGKRYELAALMCLLFILNGELIEFYVNGKFAGYNLSVIQNRSNIMVLYAVKSDLAKIGLWFFNVRLNIDLAIDKKLNYVNATLAAHKGAAKEQAGFEPTVDNSLRHVLYGGRDKSENKRVSLLSKLVVF